MGVFFGVMASLCVALNAIYTKKILPSVDNNVWRLTLYNNVNACIIFIPFMLCFGEIPVVYRYPLITSPFFWAVMSAAGVAGFAIGYVTGLQIQVTSPLTHNISGTAKACAQTVLGSLWFHEIKSVTWWVSNMVVLFGSLLYTLVKRMEMAKASKEPAVKAKDPENPEPDSKPLLKS